MLVWPIGDNKNWNFQREEQVSAMKSLHRRKTTIFKAFMDIA
jgi:hypothetical protein